MVKELYPLSQDVVEFLCQASARLRLSARSYYRVIKVGRTIADLEGDGDMRLVHVAEALQYRPKEEVLYR